MGTLTKSRIADQLNELGFTKKKSLDFIEIILEAMKDTLERSEDVLISGFGKFRVRDKRERKGRNPATGDDLTLAPRKIVTFRCSDKLRKEIN
jgi:integration host factor subunit alpha